SAFVSEHVILPILARTADAPVTRANAYAYVVAALSAATDVVEEEFLSPVGATAAARIDRRAGRQPRPGCYRLHGSAARTGRRGARVGSAGAGPKRRLQRVAHDFRRVDPPAGESRRSSRRRVD